MEKSLHTISTLHISKMVEIKITTTLHMTAMSENLYF